MRWETETWREMLHQWRAGKGLNQLRAVVGVLV